MLCVLSLTLTPHPHGADQGVRQLVLKAGFHSLGRTGKREGQALAREAS